MRLAAMIFDVTDENPPPPDAADSLRNAVRPTIDTLLDLATQLWWFWLVVGAILLFRLLAFIRHQRRLARSGIRDIDLMDGSTFEQYLATMFKRLGYRVELVGSARGDYGGDLVIRKDDIKTIVQAKRYQGKKVGIKAVQEAHTARAMYECAEAMVVTNSVFSQQAQKTARATGVRLWDRDELIKHLLKAQVEPRGDASDVEPDAADISSAAKEERSQTKCATCGAEVSDAVLAYCAANTERFDGRTYCYRHQRQFKRA